MPGGSTGCVDDLERRRLPTAQPMRPWRRQADVARGRRPSARAPEDAAAAGAAAGCAGLNARSCSRVSGPRRYDIAHRVCMITGPSSCTSCMKNTRFGSDDSARSVSARSNAAAVRRERAFEAIQQPRLVALGLKPSQEPRAGVRQPLVVEIHRILRREHDAQSVRARLLHQQQQRRFRRRIRHRRHVARDFVHVEQRAQAGRARLRAHPAHHLIEQQRDEEHPLRVAQVRDRDDRAARLAGRATSACSRCRAAAPSSQIAKLGAASRPFSRIASPKRSFSG